MKKMIYIAVLGLMLAGVSAYGAPMFTETWDFEDGTIGLPHPDWDAGTVQDTSPFQGLAYPDGKRLYTGDNTAANHTLPQATNSFIYGAEMWTDAGDINQFQATGLGYFYLTENNDVGEAWFEGDDWVTLRFGDPFLPNPRPGTSDDFDDFQWQGGSGRNLTSLQTDPDTCGPTPTELGEFYMGSPELDFDMPAVAEIEVRIEYNTTECLNPGRVEMWYRSLNYDNVRAPAGEWLLLGWNGATETFSDFILPLDPNTGEPYEVFQIKLGGSEAWSQVAFDNVYFMSGDNLVGLKGVPEPATIGLLGLGTVVLLRRRLS
jgi:hypothetical protein